MNTFLKIALILTIYPSVGAAAAGNCAAEFRAAAQSIPASLQSLGHKKFGRFHLGVFQRNTFAVEVIPASQQFVRDRNGLEDGLEDFNDIPGFQPTSRSTAHWEVKGGRRRIYVDCAWWKNLRAGKVLIAFHEFLGVFGFYDKQYWLSTGLWALTLPDAAYLSAGEKRQVNQWLVANADGGGVVGVGGGGDGVSIGARALKIKKTLAALKQARGERERAEAFEKFDKALASTSNFFLR